MSPARSSLAPIIGDSVSATTPDTRTAPASVSANSRNSEPVRPPWIADRRVDRRQRDRHRDDRPDQLARRVDRRLHRPLALVQVPLDVLHHHDRIVHDEADREDDREQRQQVDR